MTARESKLHSTLMNYIEAANQFDSFGVGGCKVIIKIPADKRMSLN